jgi:hypothetical protein
MNSEPMILTEPHRELLLFTDMGKYRVQPDYPAAQDLIREGYCRWSKDNPNTWLLNLTEKGHGAVALIKHPESVENFRTEIVDAKLVRILDREEVIGFTVKQDDNTWRAYNSNCMPYSEYSFASPAAVLLSFKMDDAKIDMHLAGLTVDYPDHDKTSKSFGV